MIESSDLDACLTTWPLDGVDHAVAAAVLGRALQAGRVRGSVIEHPRGGELLALGVCAFVRGATVAHAASANEPLVAHVLSAEKSGSLVMLESKMTREAARQRDLHLLVLAYRQRTFDMNSSQAREILQTGHASFRLMHEGYPLRGVWQEGEPSDSEWMCAGGFQLKRTYAGDGTLQRLLFGTLREEVTSAWPSHTISFLFQDRVASLRLTPMQQRVAEFALWGQNDEQVAHRLAISGETVRRTGGASSSVSRTRTRNS